jgi:hypothetical protein
MKRQQQVHGVFTLSLQTADLLYATASPEGKFGMHLAAEMKQAGVDPDRPPNADRYQFFMKRFGETVKADPSAYVSKLLRSSLAFLSSDLLRQPFHAGAASGAVLAMGSILVWRRRSRAFFAAAVAMAALAWCAVTWLPSLCWLTFSLVLAAVFEKRCRAMLGIVFCLFLGCVFTNALTGSQFQMRFWVHGDWIAFLILGAGCHALLRALPHGSAAAEEPVGERWPVPVMAGAVAVAYLLVLSLGSLLNSRRQRLAWPGVAAGSTAERLQQAARVEPTAETALLTIQLGPYRTFLPAGVEYSTVARALLRQADDRTLFQARTLPLALSDPTAPAKFQQRVQTPLVEFPNVDLTKADPWQWYHVWVVQDRQPDAIFPHDRLIHRARAWVPLNATGECLWDELRVAGP